MDATCCWPTARHDRIARWTSTSRREDSITVGSGCRMTCSSSCMRTSAISGATRSASTGAGSTTASTCPTTRRCAIARWVSGELTRDELADLLVALQNTPLVRHVHHRGLFHPHFVLKLRYRDPLGWILVHWDKRVAIADRKSTRLNSSH